MWKWLNLAFFPKKKKKNQILSKGEVFDTKDFSLIFPHKMMEKYTNIPKMNHWRRDGFIVCIFSFSSFFSCFPSPTITWTEKGTVKRTGLIDWSKQETKEIWNRVPDTERGSRKQVREDEWRSHKSCRCQRVDGVFQTREAVSWRMTLEP